MPLTQIPAHDTLIDEQFISVEGPDGLLTGFQYDQQSRALYFKESQVVYPRFHGPTHIAEDPVPNATCDTPGLMAPDDKCKLDALLQTRLGVIGYMGAGMPDDGGWMSGDIILTAGTDFLSIERIGNVIRFVVDSPVPMTCDCESCTQIFWQQDNTDITAIRPPTCSGKLPGANIYGELKVYAFPESTIADPNNTAATLNNKGNYPSLIFKRYNNAIVPGSASFEMVLKRDSNNRTLSEIGWSFLPGATGQVQCVWFTGKDTDGNQTRFELIPATDPNALGTILYKGHLLTKKMGVVVDYTSTILSTNVYVIREWDTNNAAPLGSPFTARNVWQYQNPENPTSGSNPRTLVTDATIDLLPIGELVDLWAFKVGEVAGSPVVRHYFSKRPTLNPNYLWTWIGNVQFGDVVDARAELLADAGSEDAVASEQVSAIRDFEQSVWGLTGYDDPLVDFASAFENGTAESDISQQHRAYIDTDVPALKVIAASNTPTNFSERPVILWHRQNVCNALISVDLGRPTSPFVPYDIILRAQVDQHVERYMKVVDKGSFNGIHFIRVCGVHFHDLPPFGAVRILYPDTDANDIYVYNRKLSFPSFNVGTAGTEDSGVTTDATCDSIVLTGGAANNVAYPGEVGDILELVHQEYSSPVVRVEFTYNETTGLIEVQFKVGTLDMSVKYENDDSAEDADDYVRGLAAGYAVSAVYSQAGTFTGVGTQPDASPSGLIIYEGGIQVGGTQSEYWNTLKIMLRDNQVWIWWNQLLIPPSAVLSAALPTPVTITTPYFTIDTDATKPTGKCGLRLWPGAIVRRVDLKTQVHLFNEYTYGQLSVT